MTTPTTSTMSGVSVGLAARHARLTAAQALLAADGFTSPAIIDAVSFDDPPVPVAVDGHPYLTVTGPDHATVTVTVDDPGDCAASAVFTLLRRDPRRLGAPGAVTHSVPVVGAEQVLHATRGLLRPATPVPAVPVAAPVPVAVTVAEESARFADLQPGDYVFGDLDDLFPVTAVTDTHAELDLRINSRYSRGEPLLVQIDRRLEFPVRRAVLRQAPATPATPATTPIPPTNTGD